MTEESSASIDDVRTLVAERLRFDEWLGALEARRESTPDHVFERVHGDYVARRTKVMQELHGHVPDLERLLADLDGRAESLATRSQAEEDERAEAMLRHAVGEFDDDKWEEVRRRVESTLATLSGEADAIEEQRVDVRSLLESARPEPAPAAAAHSAEDAAHTDADPASVALGDAGGSAAKAAATETSASDASAAESDGDSSSASAGEADSMGDRASSGSESSTAEWLGELTPTDNPVDQSQGEERASGESPDRPLLSDDDLELNTDMPAPPAVTMSDRPRIWGTPSRGVTTQRSGDASREAEAEDVFGDAKAGDDRKAEAVATTSSEPASGDAKPAAEFDELAFLRSVIEPDGDKPSLPRAPSKGEEQKTLRCTECSTMNLPTEWYCERCGGELAAF